MFSLICAWTNTWVNNGNADDLRLHCAHYDDTVIIAQTNSVILTTETAVKARVGESLCLQTHLQNLNETDDLSSHDVGVCRV